MPRFFSTEPGASRSARRAWHAGLVLFLLLRAPLDVRAELPVPRLDRFQPLGGSAGTTIEVEIQGPDLEEVRTLLFDHPGLKAEPVEGKERRFKISIGADVPVGAYDVWAAGRFGVTNPRLLAVLNGVTDVTEVEPNNAASQAPLIPLNAAVQGTSDQNDQDVFRFAAKRGQRLTIQCRAGKLDSAMDPTLSLTTSDGTPIASNGDYAGRDSLIDFVAPADAEYLITVSDLSFRGGHAYQLLIADRPQIENVFPRAVRAGAATELTFLGRNLGAGAKPSSQRVGDLPLDELRVTVTAPPDVLEWGAYRFREHPTDHTTLPTAATCTLVGFQAAAGLVGELGPAIPVLVSEDPVTMEVEPNDDRERAQGIALPAIVSGRFDAERDGDWYEFTPTQAGNYGVDVYCERLGGRADPYVAIVDDQGNRVTELDDYGHRVNAFDGHLRDPSGSVNLAANRKYRLLVQDRYRRGGSRYQYVLSVRPPRPDFFVAAIHRQNPGPGGTTVGKGGATFLDVIIHGKDGFNGPVTITAEQAPPGVHVAPTTLHGNSGVVVVRADENAADAVDWLRLVAQGQHDGRVLKREVRPYTRVWTDTNMSSSRPMRQLPVAVRDLAPLELRFIPDTARVEAGQKLDVTLKLNRRWADAKNNVTVLPLSFPGNFKISNQEFAGAAAEVKFSIEVAANTRPGDYTMSVLGQSQVPFAKDPMEKNRPNTLVSFPSLPLQVTVVAKDEPAKK